MIKNKIILILGVGLMLSPVTSWAAAKSVTPTKMDPKNLEVLMKKDPEALKLKIQKDINDRLKKRIEERSLQIAEKVSKDISSVKIKPGAVAQKNLKTTIEKIYDEVENKFSKLSIIDSRLSLKINAFEQEGKNVAEIRDQYDTAKTALGNARIEIDSTKNVAFTQIGIQTSKEELRSLVKMAEEKIKLAGEEYRKLLPMFAKLEGDNSIKN